MTVISYTLSSLYKAVGFIASVLDCNDLLRNPHKTGIKLTLKQNLCTEYT